MTRKSVTWSRNKTPPLKSGDYIIGGNMSQWKEDTPILKGKNNLRFENVNLRNIKGIDLKLRLRVEDEWDIFQNNIRCKGCLIMQKDIVQNPEPTEDEKFLNEFHSFAFNHGGENTVVQKIADKYGYTKAVIR